MYEKIVGERHKTALILTTYMRLEYLGKSLNTIDNQTDKAFDFFICNNSLFPDTVIGYLNKYWISGDTNVEVTNWHNRYKMFARFFLARDLANRGYDKIIFIDDDEIIPLNFIEQCHKQYDPETVKSFYAHAIDKDYWKKVWLEGDEEGNYAGTGGLIAPAWIFLENELLDCPEEYWIIDDLWLSHYIMKYTDLKIKLLKVAISFIPDTRGTFHGLKAIKQEFTEKFIVGQTYSNTTTLAY